MCEHVRFLLYYHVRDTILQVIVISPCWILYNTQFIVKNHVCCSNTDLNTRALAFLNASQIWSLYNRGTPQISQ
jgi:hypothetical protein